jgi:diguanylate cyclase (GGDEF)-like protein
MSFRGRLRVFFTIIVIVPMIALAVVLLRLAAQSETGKADAGIATGVRTALAVYQEDERNARSALQRVGEDQVLQGAVTTDDREAAAARVGLLVRRDPEITSIALGDQAGAEIVSVGEGVAPASLRLTRPGGDPAGVLSVSVTDPADYAREVRRLSGLEVAVLQGADPVASTVRGLDEAPPLGSDEFKANGSDYRVRRQEIAQPVGPPTGLVVFDDASDLKGSIADSRLLIGAILVAFLLLALATSVFVSRALQRQIGELLSAARRLAKGDFEHPVPTHGNDEFAALGSEFNTMSDQLAAYIEELETKRRELEDTIRRIGEAFASGLDRQGVVELMVRTAVDACEADAGRAVPVDRQALGEVHTGSEEPDVVAALEAAERKAFQVTPDSARRLLEPEEPIEQHAPFEASVNGVHALAIPMRARLGARSYAQHVGVVSIARYGDDFTKTEKDLLEYLTGQAVISIENADLHETVQQQAVTDELTGLSNVRSLHAALDREIERGRRFNSPLSLVMLDIDDFKKVNDEYGHQQGDEVLTGVAGVLRDMSRDIDLPARYGGEELAVVLPQTDGDGAAHVAERMREAIEALRIASLAGEAPLTVTASFGVAEIPASAGDKATLIAAADAALYRAKRAGKNRVEQAEPVAA